MNTLLGILLLLTVTGCQAEVLKGRVVGVADGDTVTLLAPGNTQTRIRLFQIDAPEKSQSFGQKSKASLSDLAFGQTVDVIVETKDRYGRTVGTLMRDGIDINLEQIRRGMAWVYRQYAHDPSYFDAEDQARKNRVGLWSDEHPMPPWVFRHGEKEPSAPIPRMMKKSNASDLTALQGCDPTRRCRSMRSCDEAMAIVAQCGPGLLDGDHDGIPCESLCKKQRR